MKTVANIKYRVQAIGILLLSLIMSGCIKENLEDCPIETVLYLKVVDLDGKDITENGEVDKADIFIFDYTGRYKETITLSAEQIKQRAPIKVIGYNTLAAWGNLNGKQSVSALSGNSNVENSTVTLNANGTGYRTTPDDLFYGSTAITLAKNNAGTTQEIVISRKVASMHITVRGLPLPQNASDYGFVIEKPYEGYNFRGQQITKDIKILETGIFNQNNNLVSPSSFNLINSIDGIQDGVRVKLIDKEGTEIVSVDEDVNGKAIAPKSGETMNVLIDISGPTAQVYLEVTHWNEIYQWVEW